MYLIDNYDARMTVSDALEFQDVIEFLTENKDELGIDDELHLSDNYLQVPRFNGEQMLGITFKARYLAPNNAPSGKYKVLELSSEDMYNEDGYGYLIPCEDFSDLTDALLEEFETDIH
jgi:hypothetical protein